MDHMRRSSLVHAKAHLSELVDLAEHKHQAVLILRHGKPAAALVPIDLVPGALKVPSPPAMTEEQVRAFFEDAARCGDPAISAVQDLLHGRR
jgi:prevent-host-death family protein